MKAFKENKIHGRKDFPFMIYKSKIPKYFTTFPTHWHDDFELITVIEGRFTVNIQTKKYICNVGDILVIPPGYIHGFTQYNEENCLFCNILFTFDLLESDENSYIYKKYFKNFLADDSVIENFISADSEIAKILRPEILELFENRHEKYETYELMVKSELYKILHNLKVLVKPAVAENIAISNLVSKIKPVIQYTKTNFSQEINVKEAAKLINMSESHFMSVFKQATGTSFINFLKICRLEHARSLLETTDKNVSEIAEESGFNNFSYFIRSFKSDFGITPLQYKKLKSK